jgi:hypothetical protein
MQQGLCALIAAITRFWICVSHASSAAFCSVSRFVVDDKKSQVGVVSFIPPLVINNLFHVELEYRLANKASSALISNGFISPKSSARIDSLHVNANHILAFKLPNFSWSK